jgi:small subunit ribosomal protein S17
MSRRQVIGVVTSDRTDKTRRVEIGRLKRHPKYGKFMRRRTVCHVHDEENTSKMGDTVEIVECPPRSALKRWELVRVVAESQQVDLAAMRAAQAMERASSDEPQTGRGVSTAAAGGAERSGGGSPPSSEG